jgi:hypothetical protein
MTFVPVFIIGAPRSGTNMLRDLLSSLHGYATWPCDEINYIWRYNNSREPTDVFPREYMSRSVSRYISSRFYQIFTSGNAQFVVEKTCANCLRLDFVDALYTNSRYIFLERSPLDAIASIYQKWQSFPSFQYILAKSRFIPYADLPYYAYSFFRARLNQLVSSDKQLKTWGPRFVGIDECVSSSPLHIVAATQWLECTRSARLFFSTCAAQKFHRLYYDEFVYDPEAGIISVLEFLGDSTPKVPFVVDSFAKVHSGSIGKHSKILSRSQVDDIKIFLHANGINF